MAYFTFEKDKEVFGKGPVGKFFSKEALEELMKKTGANIGDSIFFACNKEKDLEVITSQACDVITSKSFSLLHAKKILSPMLAPVFFINSSNASLEKNFPTGPLPKTSLSFSKVK